MTKRIYRKVIAASLEHGGQSIFKRGMPLGGTWELTLECGHIANRQPRYKNPGSVRTNFYRRRKPEDALPPPKRVICRKCEFEDRRLR